MRAVHDERTGRVRCDDESLDALLRDPSSWPASLVADERSHAALGAIGGALAEGRVVIGGMKAVLDHRFWIAPGAAAFFLSLGDGSGDLVGVAPTLVPARLARLVGLGPRRIDGERSPEPVDPDLLVDALHASELRRSSALAALGARRAWRLDLRGSAGDPVAERTMTVLDGDRGYWLVADGTPPHLAPSTATVLWRRLTTVLA